MTQIFCTLQIFERTNQIDDARDAEVFGGACAGLHGHRTQWCRTPLGENDAVDAGSIGHAQQCAEILRIFNAIEREQQAGRSGLHRNKEILDGQCFLRANNCDDALMRWCSGELCELLAGFLPDAHAGLATRGNQAGKPVVVALARDQNMVKAALAGFEGFLDGMEAVENFHESSLRGSWINES